MRGRSCALVASVLAVFCGVCIRKGGGGNWDHLPPILRPYRPIPVNLINGFFKIIGAEPMQLPSQESMMAAACKLAKLPAGAACEFDMPGDSADWKEGFHAWHKSANEEAGMHWLGRYILDEFMTDSLKTRVRSIHAWRKMPELDSTPIHRPIFIMGLHRTGSTLLFNLMSKVEGFRAPVHWEYTFPIAGEGETKDTRKEARTKIDLKFSILPGLEHMHLSEVDMPEECIFQMTQSMAGLVPMFATNATGYQTHMMSRSLNSDHMLRHHRRNLQWLQNTAGDAATPRRWLLKAPFWTAHIKDIEKFYPDAVFIFTHRAPHRTMGSLSSLMAKWRTLSSDELDFKKLGPEQVTAHEEMIRRVLEARRRWKDDPAMAGRVYDVHLADLAKDPIGTVEKLMGAMGSKVSGERRTTMQEWLDLGQSHAGQHPVDLADFGLTKEGILASPVFGEYCKEFGVAEC